MEDIKQYVMDYIEGRVSSKEFLKKLHDDSSITDWLQSLVRDGETMPVIEGFNSDGSANIKYVPYNIRQSINELLTEPGHSPTGRELNIFSLITRLIREAFPDLELHEDTMLEEKFNFLLDACPEYLDSVEIESAGILENLMEEFPDTMPKSKRIKAFKTKLKTMFYIEGQKYPRWIQESEWPLSKTGKPTKFLRQKSKGEVSYYYFLDMDTNEEIEVMQAY